MTGKFISKYLFVKDFPASVNTQWKSINSKTKTGFAKQVSKHRLLLLHLLDFELEVGMGEKEMAMAIVWALIGSPHVGQGW